MASICYSYLRFSTPAQGEETKTSQERQWNATIERVKRGTLTRDGKIEKWQLDEKLRFHDLGVSGYHGRHRRKGRLAEFLKAIRSGLVKPGSVLILENLDRLSREPLDTAKQLVRQILRAGVRIATCYSDKVFDKSSLNDLAESIQLDCELERGHRESERKGQLVSGYFQVARSWALKGQKILGARLPAWLKLTSEKQFEFFPGAKETLAQLYKLSAAGLGAQQITIKFNRENIPAIGRKGRWTRSYVTLLLRDRRAIGEYQPHKTEYETIKDETGEDCTISKRVPVGEVIENYYPAIVSKELFFKAQLAAKKRTHRRGPSGKEVTNIFSGLIKDARTNENMVIVRGRERPKLVSMACREGRAKEWLTVDYKQVEETILTFFDELKLENMLTVTMDDHPMNLENELHECEQRIAALSNEFENRKNFAALVKLLTRQEERRAGLLAKIEEEQRRQPLNRQVTELKHFLPVMRKGLEADEKIALRLALRSHLAAVIEQIYLVVYRVGRRNTFVAQVVLRDGQKYQLARADGVVLPKLDFSNFEGWKPAFKEVHWEGGKPSLSRVKIRLGLSTQIIKTA